MGIFDIKNHIFDIRKSYTHVYYLLSESDFFSSNNQILCIRNDIRKLIFGYQKITVIF